MKTTSKALLLGMYRKAMFHPSQCPDIEREEVVKLLRKVLREEGFSDDDLMVNPYVKKGKKD